MLSSVTQTARPPRLGRPSPQWEVHPGWLTEPAPESVATALDVLTLDANDGVDAETYVTTAQLASELHAAAP